MTEEELRTVVRGNSEFSKSLSRKLQAITDENTFLSPINIYSILTLLSQDPWFYNKQAFNNFLHIPDVNVAAERYKDILALLNAGDDVSVASRALLKDHHELQELFRTRLTNNFVYDVNPINFDRSEDAVRIINNWIADKTFERAKVDPGPLNGGSRLTLLNAIHFNSKWTQPFKTDNTVPAPFHINNNETIEVQMMKTRGEFNYKYVRGIDAKIIELPFVNSDISLVVILNSTNRNFGCLGDQFNYDLTQITEDMVKQEVDVSLPKFTIEESVELKKHLSELGLADALKANLIEVVKGEDINLSKIQQRAFISVNEEGSETAAGTLSNLNTLLEEEDPSKDGIIIYEMNMNTDISNRYAKTEVVWKLRNVKKHANMVNFKVVLTETAFITGFVMEIEEKSYTSYIKEKEVAKFIYNTALARGQSAGLVEATTRDSKEFTVSVNVEPEIVGVFTLTYEEMLVRVHDQYELVLNICPGQLVRNINVEVHITESKPLRFVKTPPLRSGSDISTTKNESFLDPSSEIQMKNSKTAIVKFRPDMRAQKKFAHYLEKFESFGLSGQFVLQYDVERDPQDGEVLLQDGYFVHYLAPNDLDPLPKHVVFVLDTSGSMGGTKISQLKDAMTSILGEMRKNDMINIIEFNSRVILWDINTKIYTVVPQDQNINSLEPFYQLSELTLPDPSYATETMISNAKIVVEKMFANGSTNIIGALQTALYMVKIGQQKISDKTEKCQPIIVFLTDGQPNVGLSSTNQIVEVVTLNNRDIKVPIFSLSFGNGADKNFLRKLSLKNQGFSRHIYEASDASLQLQEFYKQISSPLLADINFKYESVVEEVTRTYFPIYFGGSELVVCGKYRGSSFPTLVHCCGPLGPVIIRSTIEKPATSLERLWAYLTVKQLLEERDSVENKTELTRKAVALALKYSFVTDVTSLVVVKPTETSPLNTAYGPQFAAPYAAAFGAAPGQLPTANVFGVQPAFGSFGGVASGQSTAFGSAGPTPGPPPALFGGVASGQSIAFGSASPMPSGSLFGLSGPSTAQNFAAFGGGATTQSFGSGFGSGGPTPSGPLFGAVAGGATTQSFGFGSGGPTPSGPLFGAVAGPPPAQNFTAFDGGATQSFGFGSGGPSNLHSLFGAAGGPPTAQSSTLFGGGATAQSFGYIPTGPSVGQGFSFGIPTGQRSDISGDAFFGQVFGTSEREPTDLKKKQTEEFLADRPFHIFLQYKKDNKVIVLFQGRVCKPRC